VADQPKQIGGGRNMFGEFAPKLAALTDDVLFADVWNRPELSARDRSLITVAVLTAGGNTGQLQFHLGRAVENGVTQEELIEAITHVTLYAGWPNGMAAMGVAKQLFTTKEDDTI
jgi:4-carboxymuconolactone decarboxylase